MVHNAGPENHYATHAREEATLCPHCTLVSVLEPQVRVKNMPSSSLGNHQLRLRQSEILMVSSQNWVLPQHSTTPSQFLSGPFCNLRALQT